MSVLFTRRGAAPSLGKLASDYAVGDIVKLPVNSVNTDFIVVHQGKPSSLYSDSCNGTWLLSKYMWSSQVKWHSSTNNDFANSSIKSMLNNEIYSAFSQSAKAQIKTVKIPYRYGNGGSATPVYSGESGLGCNLFLLSAYELGWTTSEKTIPVDGYKLNYFDSGTSSAANNKRKANMTSTATSASNWWLRSPLVSSTMGMTGNACYVKTDGNMSSSNTSGSNYGVRYAFILDFSTKFDPDTNVIM